MIIFSQPLLRELYFACSSVGFLSDKTVAWHGMAFSRHFERLTWFSVFVGVDTRERQEKENDGVCIITASYLSTLSELVQKSDQDIRNMPELAIKS